MKLFLSVYFSSCLLFTGCFPLTNRTIMCPVLESDFPSYTNGRDHCVTNNSSNLLTYVERELISQGFIINKEENIGFYPDDAIFLSAFLLDDPFEKYHIRKLQTVLYLEKKQSNILVIDFIQHVYLSGKRVDTMEKHCNTLLEKICLERNLKVIKTKQINHYNVIYELGK